MWLTVVHSTFSQSKFPIKWHTCVLIFQWLLTDNSILLPLWIDFVSPHVNMQESSMSQSWTVYADFESCICVWGSGEGECHRFYEVLTAGEGVFVFHRNWSVRLYLRHGCSRSLLLSTCACVCACETVARERQSVFVVSAIKGKRGTWTKLWIRIHVCCVVEFRFWFLFSLWPDSLLCFRWNSIWPRFNSKGLFISREV